MAWPDNSRRWRWAVASAAGILGLAALWWLHAALAASSTTFGIPLLPPGNGHLLGTDSTGQDILTELLLGAPVTLMTALAATALATGLGSAAGGAAGYFRGSPDTLIMRLCDLFLVLPGLPFMIVLATLMPPGAANIVIAVAATSWPPTARVVRARVLQLREQGFVRAAQGLGAAPATIVLRHLLPNAAPIMLARASMTMAGAMLAETGLSFLGLGDPIRKSWGAMLHDAFSGGALTGGAWWWFAPPMLCIALSVLVFMELAHRWHPPEALRFKMRTDRPPLSAQPNPCEGALSAHRFRVRFAASRHAAQTALTDLSFSINRGEKVALCGHTASGKSMVLLGILNLLPPSAQIGGTLCLESHDLSCLGPEAMQQLRLGKVAYVPQATSLALNPVLRIGPQLFEKARCQGRPAPALHRQAIEVLDKMGFAQPEAILRSYPHRLSGGMRQRVAFAMALLADYEILLADEPTKNLDMRSRRACIDILNSIRDKTVLIVTHDLSLARDCADRILHLGAGVLLEDAPAPAFFENPRHPFSRLMVAAMPENGFSVASALDIPGALMAGADPCPFVQSCPEAMEICRKSPSMFVREQTRVRCWRHAD